jgi:uncharacterized protein DUF4388
MLATQVEQRTGVFAVRVEQVETLVYVAAGSVVFVEQGALGDALGRVLVREGKLTNDQYQLALRRMIRGGQPGSEPIRFGEVLVSLGFLSGQEVFEALASQVRQKTIRCLTYLEPEWTFEERAHSVGHFPCRAGRLIMTATRIFEPDRIRAILALEHVRYPTLLSDAASAGALFDMNAAEQRILNLIDGARSTEDILAEAKQTSSRDGACAVLAAVVQAGVAKLSLVAARSPIEPSAQGTSHAGHVAIGAIALKKSAQASPEKLCTPLHEAGSARPAPGASRLAGEEAFQKGRRLLDRGQTDRALVELTRAASFCTDSIEYGLARDWAEFLVSANDEKSRSAKLAALKQTASEAVKHDPSFAFGFLVLGRVASLEGFDRPSIRFFRQAVQLDPSMVEAERYLRVLTLRAPRSASSPELNAVRERLSSPERPTGFVRLGHIIKDVVARVRMPTPEAPTPREGATTLPDASRSRGPPRSS